METRELALLRVPPGDRWAPVNNSAVILESLTEGLNYAFQQNGCKSYHIDAGDGKVYSIRTEEDKPVPVKKYSIYDE
jgi:hypothetical protein